MLSSVAPLFIPGHMARLRDKAPGFDTAIIVDIEDSVPAPDKEAARVGAVDLIARLPGVCTVRINPLAVTRGFGSAVGLEDLAAVMAPGLAGVIAPKVDSLEALIEVDNAVRGAEVAAGVAQGSIPLGVVIETASGIVNLVSIADARLDRSVRLSFGSGDFTTDMGIDWTRDETESMIARSMIPIASRACGLGRPWDSVWTDVTDMAGLRASALRGKRLGYGSKPAIHPSQIAIIQDVYRPTDSEIAWARKVVEASAEHSAAGRGAFLLDGRMIDDPIVARARDVLATAGTDQPALHSL
ncbi:MAG: CoA ester lyase [Mycobacterium sp.]